MIYLDRTCTCPETQDRSVLSLHGIEAFVCGRCRCLTSDVSLRTGETPRSKGAPTPPAPLFETSFPTGGSA